MADIGWFVQGNNSGYLEYLADSGVGVIVSDEHRLRSAGKQLGHLCTDRGNHLYFFHHRLQALHYLPLAASHLRAGLARQWRFADRPV